MSSGGYVGGNQLSLGSTGSPTDWTPLCEVTGMSGLGKTNELVEITTFCSGGVKEFAPGLADGAEVTIEGNFVPTDAGLAALRAAVNSRQTRDFRLVMTDGTNTKTFYFRGACLSWSITPSNTDKNGISFTVKISGEIQEV